MRIAFIGTVEFSKKALQRLLDIEANIVAVITKEKSEFNSDFADLTPICESNKIPYKYVQDINHVENINWIKIYKPDIIFCFGWSSLLKKEILNLAPYGVLGYHPALLPKNRGRHPIIWPLVLGEQETGSTFFFMDEGVDSGDILSQEKIPVFYEDNAFFLYNKIINTALDQIENFLPNLIEGNFKKISQDHSKATFLRKRTKFDGIIDFSKSSREIYNLVRALTRPYIGAHVLYKKQEVKIWKVKELDDVSNPSECGKILDLKNNAIFVNSRDRVVLLEEHDFSVFPKAGEYLI